VRALDIPHLEQLDDLFDQEAEILH
jgi:hypothetical protein